MRCLDGRCLDGWGSRTGWLGAAGSGGASDLKGRWPAPLGHGGGTAFYFQSAAGLSSENIDALEGAPSKNCGGRWSVIKSAQPETVPQRQQQSSIGPPSTKEGLGRDPSTSTGIPLASRLWWGGLGQTPVPHLPASLSPKQDTRHHRSHIPWLTRTLTGVG